VFVESFGEGTDPFMNGIVDKKRYPGIIEERLGIEVTTRCNINCTHCFAFSGISETASLPFELVEAIVVEGYSTGYRQLHITGGEPLLWEGLFAVLDYAFDIGYQTVFLNTNGTLLSQETASRLKAYDGLWLSVSLDGPETLHESLRGKGFYKQTVAGIERALDKGIALTVFTTAGKSLLSVLHHFADDIYKKFPDIAYLMLIQLIPPLDGSFALSEELLAPEDFLQLVDSVSFLNLLGHRTCLLNNPLACAAAKLLDILWVPRSSPLYAEGSMIVMANRDIRLSHSSRYSFGKYKFGMIKETLGSDGYRKAVAADEKTCPSCKYSEICMENGMVRPPEWRFDPYDVLYCQEVLDHATRRF
jgi:MoaA/NifB/PqqE/SkfB family radical SAM enzyme